MTTGQLKDFFNYLWLACLCVARRQVDKADPPFESPHGGEHVEPHLSLTLGTGKWICFINFSDEVGPAL